MKFDSSMKIFRALAGKLRTISTERYKSVPRETVDAVVIGAGVVGIAVARELAAKLRREVLVIESAPTFGTGSSSRNSEVIHAGIYYPTNSLKATFCVKGRHLLYNYCKEHDIPHRQIGKLIVATRSSEIQKLNMLMNRGIENGVEGLRMMDGAEAMRIEPELYCTKALMSPVSGIIDSHSLMLSLLGEAESSGAIFSYNTSVIGGKYEEDDLQLYISESQNLKNWDGESPLKPDLILSPKIVVNSAGLGAVPLSKRIYGLDNGIIPRPYFARGCYFTLSNTESPPFRHLIYPIPEDGGLGVHVTLDLNGQLRFGPDVEWIDGVDDISTFLNSFDYSVPGDRATKFYPEIRKYYPQLRDESLQPGYAGIRAKISGAMQGPADFVIQGEETHGVMGLINLLGIESPGLTSSMAIAQHVAARLSTYVREESSTFSPGGLVEEGRMHFDSMTKVYQIEPKLEHYGCLIDLLSRSGLLEEAEDMIAKVPNQDNKITVPLYGALLSACTNYEHIYMGKRISKRPHTSSQHFFSCQ